jgi:hypothetical protein
MSNEESTRSGPFWDAVEGRAPLLRAAATLGLEFMDADIEKGEIELAFAATEAFTNPTGDVLGAFQAAMLYDTSDRRSSLCSSPISSNPRWTSACTFYGG